MLTKAFATLFLLLLLVLPARSQDITRIVRPERRPDVLAGLLRGPYLQMVTPNSIVIRWRTNAFTRSVVHFGEAPDGLRMTAEDSALTTEHIVRLTNLKPATKYFYSIGGGLGDTLQRGAGNYFVTLPVAGTEGAYRIGVFGDCGNNSVNQRAVRDQVVKYLGNDKHMDSWILLGDNAYSSGTDPEFQEKFFNIYKDAFLPKFPLYPAPGNHDYNDFYRFKLSAQSSKDIAYFKIFSTPAKGEAGGVPSGSHAFYSFDIGNIHFLSLDSYGKEDNDTRLYDTAGAQVQWIKKDLEAFKNKKRGWVVAYWHHPPYTMGSHNSDREGELVRIRENFIQVLERNGVDIILCGHSHLYERSKLMQGHYGFETSFDSSKHTLDHSTALYDGSKNSCPYIKNPLTNRGTVYVVTGSAGAMGRQQEAYPHNAMYYSNYSVGGASMLEVEENRLELKWISSDGTIRDRFVMMKDVNKRTTIKIRRGEKVRLTASFVGKYKWDRSSSASRSIEISPNKNTRYTVRDSFNCVEDVFDIVVSK
jgi:hypothetical protein